MLRYRSYGYSALLIGQMTPSILLPVYNLNLGRRHHELNPKVVLVAPLEADTAWSLAQPRRHVTTRHPVVKARIPYQAGNLILDRPHCANRALDGCSVGRL